MGARYDLVEPHIGIVRAPLAAALTFTVDGEFGPKGVSLDANGRCVVGTAGPTGYAGVLIKNVPVVPAGRFSAAQTVNNWMGGRVGDVVDIMTQGQIADVVGLVAGAAVFSEPDGDLIANVAAGNTRVGYTVEASRLIVQG